MKKGLQTQKFYLSVALTVVQHLPVVTICFTGGLTREALDQSKNSYLLVLINGVIWNNVHRECWC